MKTVNPSPENMQSHLSEKVDDKPVIMLNLLKFKDKADYKFLDKSHPDFAKECSGKKAYGSYSKAVVPLLWEVGGQLMWMGIVRSHLIIPAEEEWDEVALVYYPSRAAFIKMVTSEAYQQIIHHRSAALSDSRLVETQTVRVPGFILAVARIVTRLKALFSPKIAKTDMDALKKL